MPITLEQVEDQLDREEPDYAQAARLGTEALPHLITILQGEDKGLAAKAASLTGFINVAESARALEIAARHPEPVVRVAAAAAAGQLTSIPTSLAAGLLDDSDGGVRKWALKALEVHHLPGIKGKVEEIMRIDPDVGLRNRARQILNELP